MAGRAPEAAKAWTESAHDNYELVSVIRLRLKSIDGKFGIKLRNELIVELNKENQSLEYLREGDKIYFGNFLVTSDNCQKIFHGKQEVEVSVHLTREQIKERGLEEILAKEEREKLLKMEHLESDYIMQTESIEDIKQRRIDEGADAPKAFVSEATLKAINEAKEMLQNGDRST